MPRMRYFLKVGDNPEREVSEDQWVRAARQAGCYTGKRKPVLFDSTPKDGEHVHGRATKY